MTIRLPDGRTVSYVVPNAFERTEIVDAEGKATVLTWTNRACGVGDVTVPSGVTSATGSATTIEWSENCLPVCLHCSSPETNCQDVGPPCSGENLTS